MPLTAEQKSQIKKILQDYRRDVRSLVKKHKQLVVKTIETMDQKKAEKIKQLIASV